MFDAGELRIDIAGGVVAWPRRYRAGLKDRLGAIKSHIAGDELDDRPPDPGKLLRDFRIRFA